MESVGHLRLDVKELAVFYIVFLCGRKLLYHSSVTQQVGTMQLLKAKMFVPNVQRNHPLTTSVKFSDKLTSITLLNAHIHMFGK